MGLTEVLKQIDVLQQQIDQHPQLGNDLLKKIQYRFRLDWNYHSNALEGNTLTRQETRSVMINNITVEGKPLKDVLEIRGHDNVITEVLRIGKGEKPLSEKRMKEIHKAILHEEDPEKLKQAGQWKSVHNHVINYKGEKFEYANPADVSDEIHALLNETNAALENKSRHTVLIAFEFHLKFLTIHPFYDGNGRTARIFMNLLLIAAGYPPLIIKVEEKDQYNRYLADIQCYGGSPDLLYEFLGKLLLRSQELVLDAIAGKDISEPDDFEKELALIEQKLSLDNLQFQKKSLLIIQLICNQNIYPIVDRISEKLGKIDPFFDRRKVIYETEDWQTRDWNECILKLLTINSPISHFQARFEWIGSKITGANVFNLGFDFIVDFNELNYTIGFTSYSKEKKIIKKLYSEILTGEECTQIVINSTTGVLDALKERYKSHTGKDLL